MRVVILSDSFFASRERGLLLRVQVGLADEGVRVLHAVPAGSDTPAGGEVFSRVLTFTPRAVGFTRAWAARRLARAIAELDREEEGETQIVHVFGGSMWGFGAELAGELRASLALEVWRAGLIETARALPPVNPAPVFIAPDPAIERALTAGGSALTVRSAPWGVHAADPPRRVLRPDRSPSLMIIGSGHDAAAFTAALEAIAQVARRHPDLLVFCDAVAARRSGLWHAARRLNMLDRLSLIDELEARKDLVLAGDILLQPETRGEQRSIILEAFAAGVPVLAGPDPFVSVLIDGRTCRMVETRSAASWRDALSDLLANPAKALSLGTAAHGFVRENRRASEHVRAVLAAYSWMTSSQSIPFPGGRVR